MEEGQLSIGEELMVELVDCSVVKVSREALERWRDLLMKIDEPRSEALLAMAAEINEALK